MTSALSRRRALRSGLAFWLAAGLKSHAVGELLGHADAGLVDRLYGHALPDEVATAGAVLESWREKRRLAVTLPGVGSLD